MNKARRNIIILILFILTFIFINYKFNNIIVKTYDFCMKMPKILLASIAIIAFVSPTLLMKKNLGSVYNYLPDNIQSHLNKFQKNKKKNTNIRGPSIYFENTNSYNNNNNNNNSNGMRIRRVEKRKVSEQTKKYVAAKQLWKCLMCKKLLDASYEVDHRIPLYKGGTNKVDNLQALCRNCHGLKTVEDRVDS